MLKHSFFIVCMLLAFTGCKDDDSIKKSTDDSGTVTTISIAGNLGATATSGELTDYIESLTMLFFKENSSDVFVLEAFETFTLAELTSFSNVTSTTSGVSDAKTISIDSIPIGTYQVACIGNIYDYNGNALTTATLNGVAIGATMEEVLVEILSNNQSPRLFFDISENLILGSSNQNLSLVLERKISMLNMTLTNVPAAVTGIDIGISNTYDAFYANGNYLNNDGITVLSSSSYNVTETQDTVLIRVICLPTITSTTSSLTFTFIIDGGTQEIVETPTSTYTFEPNTMLDLTGNVDSSNSSGTWDISVDFGVSVNSEWNITYEPDISL